MKNKTFRAMGTDVEIIVDDSNLLIEMTVEQGIESAQEKMLTLESLLTRFREDSEISRINSGAGQWIDVSVDTMTILHLAQQAFVRTQGFFNPFMGHVMENIGYSVTFESIKSGLNPLLTFKTPFVTPIHSPMQIDENARRVRIDRGYKIDLGGIAKGWIVEQTSGVLVEHGISNFICNAGGDLVCRGTNGGTPWVVGIASPFTEQSPIFNLDVTNLSVATSGTYLRKWSLEGREMHHIIDPFLGQSVETDVVSCTVIHQSLVEAEILAKVALILGTTHGVQWLEKQSTSGWLIVKHTGEVEYSCNL